jgi:hypothetical protein
MQSVKALALLALGTGLAAAEPRTVTVDGQAVITVELPKLPVRVIKREPPPVSASVTDGTTDAVYQFVDGTFAADLDGIGGRTVVKCSPAPRTTKRREGGHAP